MAKLLDRPIFPVFLLLLGILGIYFLYLPGMGAAMMFDTEPNLRGLAAVQNFETALTFIFTGQAGPFGRPISLASFALEAHHWPENWQALRHTNVLIHIANGVLVAWATFLILRSYTGDATRSMWAALFAAMIWMASPLLASTTFMVVQRMASLTVTFMLLGVVSHLYLRAMIPARPVLGLSLVTLNLGLFTMLAVFTKENGALLPALLLVLEVFTLRKLGGSIGRKWNYWVGAFLFFPFVCIVGYLLSRWGYSEGAMAFRDFSTMERLLTQAVILWEYLFNAALPAIHRLGPFHDNYPIYRSIFEPVVLLAVLGWIGVLAAIWFCRKRLPMISFAAAWFLVAHLVESTTIGLELYFEHRNYLALIGPAVALSYAGVFGLPEYRKHLITGLVLYLTMNALVLLQLSNLWGQPHTSAEFWAEHNADSPRAIIHVSNMRIFSNDIVGAVSGFERALDIPGEEAHMRLQALALQCNFNLGGRDSELLDHLAWDIERARFSYGLVATLGQMDAIRREAQCETYTRDDLLEIAELMLKSESLAPISRLHAFVHDVKGEIHFRDQEYEIAGRYFWESLKQRIDPQVLFKAVVSWLESNNYHEGCRMLRDMENRGPSTWPTKGIWQDALRIYEGDFAEAAGAVSCAEILSGVGSDA